ncbi:uncharacterized protein BXIN_0447 [Babesia sp. Xinjiang]|uniref:uncharacterized protein n=1 Tax=Babesia sp. Xinjiang TaxID=462227 RepID=UPI000A22DFC4|nr:uncharacterized protein BXIN_0447 [Babesia sp. Xinjiang]ORM41113.1 hypothetical protein BXIN_0447 [Babesia sp. Xinjiang]
MEIHTALTEIPTSLKESLDWVTAIKKCGAATLLAKAVYDFLLHSSPAVGVAPTVSSEAELVDASDATKEEGSRPKSHLMGSEPRSLHVPTKWYDPLMVKLHIKKPIQTEVLPEVFLGHVAQSCIGISDMVSHIKKSETYVSSYGPTATWERDCAKDPSVCARIFVSMVAPTHEAFKIIKYYCTNSLHDSSSRIDGTGIFTAGSVFEALGYPLEQLSHEATCGTFDKVRKTFWRHFSLIYHLVKAHSSEPDAFETTGFNPYLEDALITAAIAGATAAGGF